MDRFKSLFLLLIFGTLVLTSSWASAQLAPQDKILFYTSLPLDSAREFTASFMKKRPEIRVEIYRAGSTQVEGKLLSERAAGGIKADLLWLADAAIYYQLRDIGELLSYVSPEAKNIPADLRDPKGYFTAARLINMIIALNKEVFSSRDGPKSWKDFPDFGDKAVMGNPLYSGANLLTVSTLVKKYGWAWFKKARAKGVVIVRGNPEAARALTGKEFGTAMTLDYVVSGLIKKGDPLTMVWPEDGAISLPSPIAIMKGTKNPDASKAFVDYVLSRQGQEFLAKQNVIPVRVDVKPPEGQPSANQIKSLPVPYEWSAKSAGLILQEFERIMLK